MHSRTRIGSAAILLTAIVGISACSSDSTDSVPTTLPLPTTTTAAPTTTRPAPVDIVATALTTGNLFTQLAGLLVDAGLVDTLRTPGPFTVFAPTDAAFAKLPIDTLHAVQADPKLLTTVLTYHVAAGTFTVADLLAIADSTGTLDTVAGIPLKITRQGDAPLVNGFPIAVADVVASNGVIHAMGDVLVPPG